MGSGNSKISEDILELCVFYIYYYSKQVNEEKIKLIIQE